MMMSSMRARQVTELAVVATAMLVGSLVFTWPLVADPAYMLPGPQDSQYNAWVLGWVAQRTAHGLSGVWDAPIHFPYKTTLAFGEPLFGIAVPFAPLYWLSGSAVLFHNIAVWASFVIAGTGGYVLGRDLTGVRAAGVLCGAIAAFLPYRHDHLSHIQVLMAGWLWWAAWSVHRYFERPTLWRAVRGAVFFIVLGLSSLYWAYAGLLALGAIAGVEALLRRSSLRVWLVHALAAGALCALAFVPVALRLSSLTAADSPVRYTVDARSYHADLKEYVPVLPRWVPGSAAVGYRSNETIFPGLTAASLTVLALARRRSPGHRASAGPWTVVYAVIAAVGIVLSLGAAPAAGGRVIVHNPAFSWLADHVPGFAQLRASARFVVIVQLAVSVLAARGLAAWLEGRQRSRRATVIVGALASGLVFLEGLSLPVDAFAFSPYRVSGDRSATYWLSRHPGGSVVELPLDGWGAIHYSIFYQHRTLLHGHAMVGGVSRYVPPLLGVLGDPDSPLVAPDRAPEAVALLRGLGVRYVVVHSRLYERRDVGEAMQDALVAASGQPSVSFGEVTVVDVGPSSTAAALPGARELPVTSMLVAATAGDVAGMLDGESATWWSSGRPQSPADRIDISLPSGPPVSGVRLQVMEQGLADYPCSLDVSVSRDGVAFTTVFSGSVLPALGAALGRAPAAPAIELRWAAVPARAVRLQQTGTSERRSWSVHELRVLTPVP